MAANNIETLFSWYFRFNGYFTILNFSLHKDFKKKPGGGENDLIGVRFPYSKEEPRNHPFERDQILTLKNTKIDFIIVEIKTSRCDINESLLNKEYCNIQYVLKWMGFLNTPDEIEEAALGLYNNAIWETNDNHIVRIICCGNQINEKLKIRFPNLLQIDILQVLKFMHTRFRKGCNGIMRNNWDAFIQALANKCETESNPEKVLEWILKK